jgi:hypothetical protein
MKASESKSIRQKDLEEEIKIGCVVKGQHLTKNIKYMSGKGTVMEYKYLSSAFCAVTYLCGLNIWVYEYCRYKSTAGNINTAH